MKYKTKKNLSQFASILFLAGTSLTFFAWNFGHARNENENKFSGNTDEKMDSSSQTDDYFIKADVNSSLNVDDLINSIKKQESSSVKGIYDASIFTDVPPQISDALSLASDGYFTTSQPYDASTTVLAVMNNMKIQNEFSIRKKNVKSVSYEQDKDYAPFEAKYYDVEADRPLIELYMGYIFIDNGTTLDIYSRDGIYQTSFDDSDYIPAYARDINGRPLFYKTTTVECLPYGEEYLKRKPKGTRVREPHDREKNVWVEAKLKNKEKGIPSTEEKKVYYTLNSSYFSLSDYNERTDGRGINFDYPAYYGISDNNMYVSGKNFDTYSQSIDGTVTVKHTDKWAFARDGVEVTDYIYDKAYNMSEGLGCVSTEPYYQDGGMFFVRPNGTRAFNTVKKYNNTALDRYIIENILPPLSYGPESIGYFYYDHGLVRARLEVIDYWNYTTNNLFRYNSSVEVLLDSAGNVFPIPVGYEIKAYSNGMILLEKDGLFGFMDYTGAWIAEPIYSHAEAFSEGLAVLKTQDGRYGMIDTSGNIVLPFSYKYISSASDGIIAAYNGSEWNIIRKMKK